MFCTEKDICTEQLEQSITVYIPSGVAKDLRLNQLAGLPRTPVYFTSREPSGPNTCLCACF